MSPEGNMPHETSQIQNGKCCQTAFLLETQGESPTDNKERCLPGFGGRGHKADASRAGSRIPIWKTRTVWEWVANVKSLRATLFT